MSDFLLVIRSVLLKYIPRGTVLVHGLQCSSIIRDIWVDLSRVAKYVNSNPVKYDMRDRSTHLNQCRVSGHDRACGGEHVDKQMLRSKHVCRANS